MSKKNENWIDVNETIDANVYDGAYNFSRAVKEICGEPTPKRLESFLGSYDPDYTNIEIGLNQHARIIWGAFTVPRLEGHLATSYTGKDGRYVFKIGGKLLMRDIGIVERLANRTRELLKTNSIYKGKAIKVKAYGKDGELNLKSFPRFMDTTQVSADDLFFSDRVKEQIHTGLFAPIEHTDACRKAGFPLKRGVLLAGPYGTGKTLTAYVTAQKCQQNGWTFIMLDRVQGLKGALELARQYSPAVVFAEDIDREVAGDERTVGIDDVLNTIDGLESKGTEIITILTSNHVEMVNRAMLRPGRLDAVIKVHPPDAAAAEKLLRNYSRSFMPEGEDLSAISQRLAGVIPAVIREVVERAKLYSIQRSNGQMITVTTADLERSLESMSEHLELMRTSVADTEEVPTPEEALGSAFSAVVQESVKGNGLYSKVERIYNAVT